MPRLSKQEMRREIELESWPRIYIYCEAFLVPEENKGLVVHILEIDSLFRKAANSTDLDRTCRINCKSMKIHSVFASADPRQIRHR